MCWLPDSGGAVGISAAQEVIRERLSGVPLMVVVFQVRSGLAMPAEMNWIWASPEDSLA